MRRSLYRYQRRQGPSPSGIRVFDVAQVTGPGEVAMAPLLPSFLYFPTEAEVSSGAVDLPWEHHPSAIAGIMARNQGALTSDAFR